MYEVLSIESALVDVDVYEVPSVESAQLMLRYMKYLVLNQHYLLNQYLWMLMCMKYRVLNQH